MNTWKIIFINIYVTVNIIFNMYQKLHYLISKLYFRKICKTQNIETIVDTDDSNLFQEIEVPEQYY